MLVANLITCDYSWLNVLHAVAPTWLTCAWTSHLKNFCQFLSLLAVFFQQLKLLRLRGLKSLDCTLELFTARADFAQTHRAHTQSGEMVLRWESTKTASAKNTVFTSAKHGKQKGLCGSLWLLGSSLDTNGRWCCLWLLRAFLSMLRMALHCAWRTFRSLKPKARMLWISRLRSLFERHHILKFECITSI